MSLYTNIMYLQIFFWEGIHSFYKIPQRSRSWHIFSEPLPRPAFSVTHDPLWHRGFSLHGNSSEASLTTRPKEASWALLRHTILFFFHQSIYKCLMFPCSHGCLLAQSVTLYLVDISFFNVHSSSSGYPLGFPSRDKFPLNDNFPQFFPTNTSFFSNSFSYLDNFTHSH